MIKDKPRTAHLQVGEIFSRPFGKVLAVKANVLLKPNDGWSGLCKTQALLGGYSVHFCGQGVLPLYSTLFLWAVKEVVLCMSYIFL